MGDLLESAFVQLFVFSLVPFIWWRISAYKKQKFLNWIGFKKPIFTISKTKILIAVVLISLIYGFVMNIIVLRFMSNVNTATIQFRQ